MSPETASRVVALSTAAARHAAATAETVSVVVSEALRFYARCAQDAGTINRIQTFKAFGERAHANSDACTAACAETRALAAELGDGNARPAVVAAGRAGFYAMLTAATAREAAQLCMGILEEAVHANALPHAREVAKRCAEQALRGIEAANLAEQNGKALSDFVEGMLGAEPQPSPSPSLEASAVPAATASTSAAPETGELGSVCWWQGKLTDELAAFPQAAPRTSPAGDVRQTVIPDADSMEEHLARRAQGCSDAANCVSTQDARVLRTIVDWRFGRAVALGCCEDEVLSDTHVARLASWRGSLPLPNELQASLASLGSKPLATLVAGLRQSNSEELRAGEVARAVKPVVGGEFRPEPAAAEDWDRLCKRLGWVQTLAHQDSGKQSVTETKVWQDLIGSLEKYPEGMDAAEQDWSVDALSFRELHFMSLRSRTSRQRRGCVAVKPAKEDKIAAENEEDLVEALDWLQQSVFPDIDVRGIVAVSSSASSKAAAAAATSPGANRPALTPAALAAHVGADAIPPFPKAPLKTKRVGKKKGAVSSAAHSAACGGATNAMMMGPTPRLAWGSGPRLTEAALNNQARGPPEQPPSPTQLSMQPSRGVHGSGSRTRPTQFDESADYGQANRDLNRSGMWIGRSAALDFQYALAQQMPRYSYPPQARPRDWRETADGIPGDSSSVGGLLRSAAGADGHPPWGYGPHGMEDQAVPVYIPQPSDTWHLR